MWQKLQGHTWLEGTAVSYASDRRTSCALRCRALSADRPVASAVLTYGTLALELSVGILIWSPRARRFVLVPAILLHVLVDATLAAGLISAAMLTAFVAFVHRRPRPAGFAVCTNEPCDVSGNPRRSGEPSQNARVIRERRASRDPKAPEGVGLCGRLPRTCSRDAIVLRCAGLRCMYRRIIYNLDPERWLGPERGRTL